MPKREYPPVPKDLEKWELRGGFVSAFLALAILIYFLETISLHFGVKIPVPHHKHHYKVQRYNLVPEFWFSIALAIGTLFATHFNKRQILAIMIVFQGLMLVSFATQFDPIIPLPFVIFGVWLMLRASRRTRQLAAQGLDYRGRSLQDRRSGRSKTSQTDKSGKPSPGASKRYTPPSKKRSSSQGPPGSVGIGRGGMIKGDLPKKSENDKKEDSDQRSILDRKLSSRKDLQNDTE